MPLEVIQLVEIMSKWTPTIAGFYKWSGLLELEQNEKDKGSIDETNGQ